MTNILFLTLRIFQNQNRFSIPNPNSQTCYCFIILGKLRKESSWCNYAAQKNETSVHTKQRRHGVTLNLAVTFHLQCTNARHSCFGSTCVCEIVFDNRETQKTIPVQTLQTVNRQSIQPRPLKRTKHMMYLSAKHGGAAFCFVLTSRGPVQ